MPTNNKKLGAIIFHSLKLQKSYNLKQGGKKPNQPSFKQHNPQEKNKVTFPALPITKLAEILPCHSLSHPGRPIPSKRR